VKAASRLISEAKQINYIGFVEGTDIYRGTADVIVCDGFVGNIALKASEGILRAVATAARQYLTSNWWRKCIGLVLAPFLRHVAGHLDPRKYNGACLIGLRGIVIKSHGGADRSALTTAIHEAVKEVNQNVPSKIQQEVAQYLQERQAS
jgi:glycerol-3-phosphate acyltransferase PlsX